MNRISGLTLVSAPCQASDIEFMGSQLFSTSLYVLFLYFYDFLNHCSRGSKNADNSQKSVKNPSVSPGGGGGGVEIVPCTHHK